MRLPTGSKLGLAIDGCTFPWSPHAPRWPKYETSAAAELGNAVHALAEAMTIGQQHREPSPEAAVYVSAIRAALDEIRDRLNPTALGTEIPVAFDCLTGAARRLPKGSHRDYTASKPTEIVATADVIASGDRVAVLDYKTGRNAREHATRDTWQMLFLGLVVARIYKLDTIEIALVHLEPGDHWIDWHTLDAFDLDNIEEAIRSLYVELVAGQQTPRPGTWCQSQYCPIRSSCPATTATLARISEDAARHLPVVADITSPEEAARVRVGLKLVEEATKQYKAKLEEYLRANGAVDLGDGRYLGIVEQSRDTVALTHDAAEALQSMLGAEIAREAIEVKTSRSAIETACKARQTKRGEGAKRAGEAMDLLREMGAVKTSTYARVDEFTRKNEDEGEAA